MKEVHYYSQQLANYNQGIQLTVYLYTLNIA